MLHAISNKIVTLVENLQKIWNRYKVTHVEHFVFLRGLPTLNSILNLKYPHCGVFTFSKQAFNESLDFCNRPYPH